MSNLTAVSFGVVYDVVCRASTGLVAYYDVQYNPLVFCVGTVPGVDCYENVEQRAVQQHSTAAMPTTDQFFP